MGTPEGIRGTPECPGMVRPEGRQRVVARVMGRAAAVPTKAKAALVKRVKQAVTVIPAVQVRATPVVRARAATRARPALSAAREWPVSAAPRGRRAAWRSVGWGGLGGRAAGFGGSATAGFGGVAGAGAGAGAGGVSGGVNSAGGAAAGAGAGGASAAGAAGAGPATYLSAESCNGLDDDGNGQVDDMGTITCGVGQCEKTVSACAGGAVNVCVPNAPDSGPDGCDGVDNDCDGAVDEDCAKCLHVAPDGDDAAATAANGATSFRSVQAAIDFADSHRSVATRVCVAAGAACGASATFNGPSGSDLTMRSGIDVLGGYESTAFTRCTTSTTHFAPQTGLGVLFPANVADPTVLDGFTLDRFSADVSAAVTVDGAKKVTLSNLVITGGLVATSAYGVNVIDGGEALVFADRIDPGAANTSVPFPANGEIIGVRSVGSLVRVEDSCPGGVDSVTGRCDQACSDTGPEILVNFTTQNGPELQAVAGVLLESSPGSRVERSAVCFSRQGSSCGTDTPSTVVVHGAADGVVLRANSLHESVDDRTCPESTVYLSDCGGAAPWIADNARVDMTMKPGAGSPSTIAAAGSCNPVIDSNAHVTVAVSSAHEFLATPIRCDAANGVASGCVVAGNADVRASLQDASTGFRFEGRGVDCTSGSCTRISSNTIVGIEQSGQGGTGYSQKLYGTGVRLSGPTLVSANSITGIGNNGWCSVRATGVDLGAPARLENNLILGMLGSGGCSQQVDQQQGQGIYDHGSGAVTSNFIASTLACASSTSVDPTTAGPPPVDVWLAAGASSYRNNVFGGACAVSFVENGTEPIFESNSLRGAYADLSPGAFTHSLLNVAELNGLTPTISDNIVACAYTSDHHLTAGSACIDAGTTAGAPARDFDGDPRDSHPDIGPDEYVAP